MNSETIIIVGILLLIGLAIYTSVQLFLSNRNNKNVYKLFINFKDKWTKADFEQKNELIQNNSGTNDIFEKWRSIGENYKRAGIHIPPHLMEDVYTDKISKRDNKIKTIINSLTIWGLIFTFLGLSITVYQSMNVINQFESNNISYNSSEAGIDEVDTTEEKLSNVDSFDTLISSLKSPLDGMVIAFLTSLFGLFFAVILGYVNSGRISRRDNNLKEVNFFIRNHLIPFYAPLTTELRIEDSFSALQKQIMQTLDGFYSLHKKTVEKYNEELQEIIDQGENKIRDVSDNALNRLEQINSSFIEITTDILNKYGSMQELVASVSNSSERITDAANRFNEHIDNFNELSQPLIDVKNSFGKFIEELNSLFNKLLAISEKDEESNATLRNLESLIGSLYDQVINIKELLDNPLQIQNDNISRDINSIEKSLNELRNEFNNQEYVKKLDEIKDKFNSTFNINDENIIANIYELRKSITSTRDELLNSEFYTKISDFHSTLNEYKEMVRNNNGSIIDNISDLKKVFEDRYDKENETFVKNLSVMRKDVESIKKEVKQRSVDKNINKIIQSLNNHSKILFKIKGTLEKSSKDKPKISDSEKVNESNKQEEKFEDINNNDYNLIDWFKEKVRRWF